MITIGIRINKVVKAMRRSPLGRGNVLNWMRNNRLWYRELIAQEWEKQTGEPWEEIFKSSMESLDGTPYCIF